MPENHTEESDIEIRSEEVQEILSHIPNWIIRWGITAIFFTVLVLITASWFIEYPDKVSARILLTTQTPPAKIIARSNGNITFFVEDNQKVSASTLLGVIENPASMEDILYLKKELKKLHPTPSFQLDQQAAISLKEDLNLGTIQSSYLTFIKSMNEFKRFKGLGYQDKQIKAINNNINKHLQRSAQLKAQNKLLKQEVGLVYKQFENDSILYKQGAGTKTQMNISKGNYIRTLRSLESAKTSIIDNAIQISSLQKQVNEIQLQRDENHDRLIKEIDNAFKQLESQLQAWEQQYLLISPIGGNITFSKYWSDNQFVNTNEEVMTVIPKSQDIFGQVYMPIIGSGKVEEGQRVNIKFDNYPSNEYGMIVGTVESISSVPRDNMYTIKVSFPEGLVSSYNKKLEFKQEMQGSADIITKDLRLIERIFNQVRSLVDNAT